MPPTMQEPPAVTDADYSRKADEIERLLNDPDVQLQPARVWALLAELRGGEPGFTPPDPSGWRSGTPDCLPAR